MMWKNKGFVQGKTTGFFLCLNGKASEEITWHCKHYKGRGLMKSYKNMAEFAKEHNMPLKNIEETFKNYNEVAKKQAENPDAGPYDAYGGGKSHDQWGKKFFHNLPLDVNDTFHVGVVTPVIHYCMGGLRMTPDAEIQTTDGSIIPGLYAAGEAMGGVHGSNRLGGNSLLDCVVFGRVSGRAAAKHLTSSNIAHIAKAGGAAASSKL